MRKTCLLFAAVFAGLSMYFGFGQTWSLLLHATVTFLSFFVRYLLGPVLEYAALAGYIFAMVPLIAKTESHNGHVHGLLVRYLGNQYQMFFDLNSHEVCWTRMSEDLTYFSDQMMQGMKVFALVRTGIFVQFLVSAAVHTLSIYIMIYEVHPLIFNAVGGFLCYIFTYEIVTTMMINRKVVSRGANHLKYPPIVAAGTDPTKISALSNEYVLTVNPGEGKPGVFNYPTASPLTARVPSHNRYDHSTAGARVVAGVIQSSS